MFLLGLNIIATSQLVWITCALLALEASITLRLRLCDLLGNVVKYGLPGRWVRIETDNEPGSTRSCKVRIRVCDRG